MRAERRETELPRNSLRLDDPRLRRDRDEALATGLFSRETSERLDLYVAELLRWQEVTNLVGPGTLPVIWTRHFLDSVQLREHAPHARRWADLGAGAGFPGLVLAIAGRSEGIHVDLVESNQRKCAFLRRIVELTDAPATIHAERIETAAGNLEGIEIVTARALAPLTRLLAWADPLLTKGAVALFPKGRDAATELTTARISRTFACEILPSRVDPASQILRISGLHSRDRPGA